MKRYLILSLVALLLAASLSSCRSNISDQTDDPSADLSSLYGEDGKYTGFSDIPEGYTADAAIADGCMVIERESDGTNVHGVELSKTVRAVGEEHFKAFFDASERGDAACLRVAYFKDGVGSSYYDLHFSGGRFTLFTLNENGLSESESFSHLRKLDGMTGPAGDQKEHHYYVLTDSLDLTYEDVSWSYLSSSVPTVTTIPFVTLWFMNYFN